jgi:hypothetical protein
MRLLRIDGSLGQFLGEVGDYRPIDKITKDDLLRLVDLTLREEDVEFDEYDEEKVKNQAHQIVYKSIFGKLRELRGRKQESIDQSERLYLAEYERYRGEASQQNG